MSFETKRLALFRLKLIQFFVPAYFTLNYFFQVEKGWQERSTRWEKNVERVEAKEKGENGRRRPWRARGRLQTCKETEEGKGEHVLNVFFNCYLRRMVQIQLKAFNTKLILVITNEVFKFAFSLVLCLS